MIVYLHDFDSNRPGNHEKIMQLQFIDSDVRFISYSTSYSRHDMHEMPNSQRTANDLHLDDIVWDEKQLRISLPIFSGPRRLKCSVKCVAC